MSSLEKMKEQIETIRMRQRTFRQVPTPEIIPIFKQLSKQHQRKESFENKKNQIIKLKKWLAKFNASLEREQKAYEERYQMLKDHLLIHKAFLKTLAAGYEETRKNYQEVELMKTLIGAYRRCYLFRLAQIFLNDSAINLFKDFHPSLLNGNVKPDSKSIMISDGSEELSGTSLSYSMLLVFSICKIFNIQLINEYVFKGSKSCILSADKNETVLLYRMIGKSTENALKLCSIDVAQVFDALGINRKAKSSFTFKQKIDLLSKYLISTDMQEIHKLI